MYEFTDTAEGVSVARQKQYRLVPPSELSPEDLAAYSKQGE
jgi:hypothetical protein